MAPNGSFADVDLALVDIVPRRSSFGTVSSLSVFELRHAMTSAWPQPRGTKMGNLFTSTLQSPELLVVYDEADMTFPGQASCKNVMF